MRYSRLSRYKSKKIIECFSEDITASSASKILILNRKTVNSYYNEFRERILAYSLKEQEKELGEFELDESYFGVRRVRNKRGQGARGKTKVLGMKKRGDKVYTQIVNNCSVSELVPIIKKLAPSDSTIYSDEWKAYDGLVNAGYKKHYRVTHSEDVFANGRAHVNGVENFWEVAKNRLVKMRGITCEKFNLHLKETEWCFNHRHENIYKLLLTNLRNYPL